MATINNVEDAADSFLQSAALAETSQDGVSLAESGGTTALTSESKDIDLSGASSDNAILAGDSDLDVTADGDDNVVVGNDGDNVIDADAGNDQVSTGAGDDTIDLGAGNDFIEITGAGEKMIDGGAGNDTFVFDAAETTDDASDTTLTSLNRGDSVRLTISDSNGDGTITVDDIEGITASDNDSVTFNLKDGTSFTLDGVEVSSATDGYLNYSISDNGDGTFDVEIT